MGVITHIAARVVLFECAMTDDKLVIVCCNEPFSVNIKNKESACRRGNRHEGKTNVRTDVYYSCYQRRQTR